MPLSPTPNEVRELSRYLRDASGIELDESKGYLFETRLGKLVDELGCKTLTGLLERAHRDLTGKLRGAIVDAISTNETSFFREAQQFTLLAHHLLPQHFEHYDSKRLRIWCAAASTGQELYSVAILLKELLGSLSTYQISILGTDISGAALERASRGLYSMLEVSRGLSQERLLRHFVRRADGYQICDELRGLARFQRQNLLEDSASIGMFDVILCRNVAIYFSPSNRLKLFSNLAQHLRPGGFLIVSLTETVQAHTSPYVRKEFRGLVYYEKPVR